MHPPQPPEGAVATPILSRLRLLGLIEVPAQAPVTLVSAPAGFGKTTLATQWAAQATDHVAWLSLDAGHNDPGRFLRDLAAAVLHEGASPTEPITVQDIRDQLCACARERPITIVLDDLHIISNDAVLRYLIGLLRAPTPNVHWLILSRIASGLSLARLRANGQVREVGMADLAFTRGEAAGLVKMLGGRPPSENSLERLLAFTGGWVAGIALTIRASGQSPSEREDDGVVWATAIDWIDHYLADEVVDVLPPAVRRFLLRTCSLPFLAPDFASHVADVSEDEGRRILAELEQRFIVQRGVTESGVTLDYAGWIAPGLTRIAARRLSREEGAVIHERAIDYLLDHGQYALALEEARKVDNLALRVRIVRRVHAPLALQDRTVLVRELLETLAAPTIQQYSDLAYSNAHALFHRGDSTPLALHVAQMIPEWRTSSDPVIRGYALNCKAFVLHRAGDAEGALRNYSDALMAFPRTNHRERLHALAGVVDSASILGNDDLVESAMAEGAACVPFLPRHQVTWWMNMHTQIANHHALRGRISRATELYEHTLSNTPPTFMSHRPYFGYRRAGLAFESNALANAEELITSAIDSIEERSPDDWHANVLALGARIAHARGERELADVRLRQAHETASRLGNQNDLMQVETIRASWNIEDGDLSAARAWEDYWYPRNRRWIQVFGQLNPIATSMQLRIAERRFDDAIGIGDEALIEGRLRKRHAESISILMWSAIARECAGDHDGAMCMLRRALELRTDNAIVRAYATPGYDLARWRSAELPPDLRTTLEDLITRLDARMGRRAERADSVPELTARELEVLALLADSLSNQEIGLRLSITERTVKKHVSNILRKLDLPNRTAIVLHARSQGWIDG